MLIQVTKKPENQMKFGMIDKSKESIRETVFNVKFPHSEIANLSHQTAAFHKPAFYLDKFMKQTNMDSLKCFLSKLTSKIVCCIGRACSKV